ncbi:MAG TPA: fluoride efflux transporter CrcB [Gammaproteobacteria bacterium]|jgi:CrcB protein|nr:fluoride efflux transporter CrcB [Gammaproteobacteria bacterium]
MWNYVAVALGGAFGCCARLGVNQLVHERLGQAFPFATLIINVSGCLVMGFLFFYTLEHVSVSPALRLGIITGVLGGFTTFSAFGIETLLLMEDGKLTQAALYVGLSVLLGIAAVFAGSAIARNLA